MRWALTLVAALALLLGAAGARAGRAAEFAVTYTDSNGEGFYDATSYNGSTLGAARRASFQASLSYWSQRLGPSLVPITVNASFDNLGGSSTSATLGRAGYNTGHSDFTSSNPRYRPATIYGGALANYLAGRDLAEGTADITAQFNSDVDNDTVLGTKSFYYGSDTTLKRDIDFYGVALHEVGHGLNFLALIDSNGTFGGGTVPGIYDRFLTQGSSATRARLTDQTPAERQAAIVSDNLFFDGPRTQVENGFPAKLYAPAGYSSGSSVSHLDEGTFSLPNINELMTPISSGAIRDAGPVGLGVFYDMGWGIPPFVASVTRLDPSPANARSVRFRVLFSAPVTGVNASDFALSTTGSLSNARITGVSGSGNTYEVTVAIDGGSGSLRLDLVDDDSIQDASGLLLGGTGTTSASGGDGSFSTGAVYTLGPSGSLVSLVAVNSGDSKVVGFDITTATQSVLAIANKPLTNSLGVARASDGTLFVSNFSLSTIVKLSPDGSLAALPVPSSNLLNHPYDVVIGPDGMLYVCNIGDTGSPTAADDSIVRVNPSSGAQVLVSSNNATQNSLLNTPAGLAFGPDGRLYIGNRGGFDILSLDVSDGVQSVYASDTVLIAGSTTNYSTPWGIAFGPGGVLYANDSGPNARVLRVEPGGTSASTVTPIGALANLRGLALGGDGNLYAATGASNTIVRVTTSGARSVVTSGGHLNGVSDVATVEVPLPTVSITGAPQVLEGDSGTVNAAFTLNLSGPMPAAVTVTLQTADGTATAGSDYVALPATTYTFAPGDATPKTISVAIQGDAVVEADETFTVRLSSPSNATLGTPTVATATILNDDAPATSGALISEFRLHGASSTDEFVEIANVTSGPINVGGWSLDYAGIGLPVEVAPNTLLPRGARLLFKGTGYGLSSYAPGDVAMSGDAADNSGVALLNAGGQTVDAVGFTTSDASRREGAGLSAAPTANGQYSFVRDNSSLRLQDSGSNTTSVGGKGDNAADFLFVSTLGGSFASITGTQSSPATGLLDSILGAPGPQGASSPLQPVAGLSVGVLDSAQLATASPNRVRLDDAGGTYGSILLRRKLSNTSGKSILKLRFRAVRITTKNSPAVSGQADVRLISSSDETGSSQVSTSAGLVDVFGTTLEAAAPLSQSGGGGLNSSVVQGTLTLAQPLPSGTSRNYSFRLGVMTKGSYALTLSVEGSMQ